MAEEVGGERRYVFSDDDFAVVKSDVFSRIRIRVIYAKYVANRKYGAKKWSIGVVKIVAACS